MQTLDPDAYLVITPFGGVEAHFDSDASGIRLKGAPDGIAHLKDVLAKVTGADGHMLSITACSPDDFYRFCQPDWSGIKIMPPFDVAAAYAAEQQALVT